MPKIAVLQMNSGIDPEVNLDLIERAVEDAAKGGAELIFTPEMSVLLDRKRSRSAEWVESQAVEEAVNRLAKRAIVSGIDIALGSMPVACSSKRWANRSFFFRRNAGSASPISYDKIHMFDVELSTGEAWRESKAYEPGNEAVTIDDTPIGRLGLTICYDIRFPDLFNVLGLSLIHI